MTVGALDLTVERGRTMRAGLFGPGRPFKQAHAASAVARSRRGPAHALDCLAVARPEPRLGSSGTGRSPANPAVTPAFGALMALIAASREHVVADLYRPKPLAAIDTGAFPGAYGTGAPVLTASRGPSPAAARRPAIALRCPGARNAGQQDQPGAGVGWERPSALGRRQHPFPSLDNADHLAPVVRQHLRGRSTSISRSARPGSGRRRRFPPRLHCEPGQDLV